MLNVAVFKGCNNIHIVCLPANYLLGCYFTVFLFFFFPGHVFSNSGKIATSILSCPDCMKKSLIALFICSAHKRLQSS